MHDESDDLEDQEDPPPPKAPDEFSPAMLELFGGSAELAALADEDANELLRFVESSMTEDEAAGFIARVEHRDPLAAMRLIRMRDDHRLLRTTGEVPLGRDLLGPVRARVARGELVADSNFAAGSAEPTEFMERSLESLARRRRRARRRPAQFLGGLLILAGILVLAIWIRREMGPGSELGELVSAPVAVEPSPFSLSSFGLVVPIVDSERFESEMALVAVERGAVLLRNVDDTVDSELQPPPVVGALGDPVPVVWRRDLARRGFGFAVIARRADVAAILAEIGAIGTRADARARPRLVPVDEGALPSGGEGDAWKSWSDRSQAMVGGEAATDQVIVPVGLTPIQNADRTDS